MRLTEEQYSELTNRWNSHKSKPASLPPAKKQSKYRSRKVEVDGITFDSAKEARRWGELKLRESAGEISNLRRQVPYVLAPAVVIKGRKKPALRYFADAVYDENGREVCEDTKSDATRKLPVYRIKLHLLAVMGIEIKEV